MKLIYLICALFITGTVWGQKIHHTLSMPQPQTHYFHITTELTGFPEDTLVLVMPVWAPGSYKIREFPKNVNQVVATNEDGKQLPVQKIRKNKWQIVKGKANKVTVKYESYAFDLTVRTAFLDNTHGFLNGENVFTFPQGYKQLGGTLTIIPPSIFKKITVPLTKASDGVSSDDRAETFTFKNFDELADSPMEIGNQVTFDFTAAGVLHHVAIYGPGNFDKEVLKKDMAKIVETETAIWGQNPNKEYWFIIHNVIDPNGGLEHKKSTTLSVDRWTYSPDKINDFLETMAHEYFHLWNVKRLRPANLVHYNYSKEDYTNMLWMMEGFTSYYSLAILARAGFYTPEKFLSKYKSKLNWIESMPGNRVQSVAMASYDAWIKAYLPNENSQNTTVSYYSKGALIAGIFNAMIIKSSNGKKNLDDFMQLLYKKYYKKNNIGVTLTSVKEELEKFTGLQLDDFFANCIQGTQAIPYAKYLDPLGIEVDKKENQYISMGMSTYQSGGKVLIGGVRSGSAAEKFGLSPKDEIIAFNGFRVDQSDLKKYLLELQPGEKFNLIISRDKQLKSIDATMGVITKTHYDLTYDGKNKLGKVWLNE